MQIKESSLADQPIQSVQIDSLVLYQIIKNASIGGGGGGGRLLGVEENGILILTNSYAIPVLNSPISSQIAAFTLPLPLPTDGGDQGGSLAQGQAQTQAQAQTQTQTLEDEFSIKIYQEKVIEILKEMEFESNHVGWFSVYSNATSNLDLIIDQQFIIQSDYPQAIHLMYEPKRTDYQSPTLTALRLTDEFMTFYATRNFGGKSVKTHGISHSNIFQLLPIKVKNSHMMAAVHGDFDIVLTSPDETTSASSNIISSEKYLERQLEALIDCVEDQGQEYWRWQAWHRGYHKEQQKVSSTLLKMNHENEKSASVVYDEAALAAASTSVGLGKSIAGEPGRLDTLLLSQQVNMISDQLSQFCA